MISKLLQEHKKLFNLDIPPEKDTAAEDSLKGFGSSKEFVLSASYALEGRNMEPNSLKDLSSSLEAAHKIASCAYEHNTDWGNKVSDNIYPQ